MLIQLEKWFSVQPRKLRARRKGMMEVIGYRKVWRKAIRDGELRLSEVKCVL